LIHIKGQLDLPPKQNENKRGSIMPILSEDFIEKYKTQVPPFGPIGYVVYKRTYSRFIPELNRNEEWWETCRREVDSIYDLGCKLTKEEAEQLYDYCFNLKCSFSGRGKWQLGTKTVEKLGGASLNACWGLVLDSWKAFIFAFDASMLGGGVGTNIQKEFVYELPKVKKGVSITRKDTNDADFIVPDSREGWCELLYKTMESWFETGKSFSYSTVCVRGKDVPIKGFGGISSGPEELCKGIKNICDIFKNREGKKLRPIDCLDILNIIGMIVVSGNVRRCLPSGSLVHTDIGMKKIEDIKIGDKVLTSGKTGSIYHRVTNIFNQGEQELVTINTEIGEFKCTPNHKIAYLTSPHEYKFKEARELNVDDRLIFSEHELIGSTYCLPDKIEYINPSHSTTCRDFDLPVLDENMAWFIGYFLGNGYAYANSENNGFNAYISVCFDSRAEWYNKLLEKLTIQFDRFGLKTWIRPGSEKDWGTRVGITSKLLAKYFEDHIKKSKEVIRIPEWIMNNNPSIKKAFIAGIFDADGCGRTRPLQLCTTVYEEFTKDIKTICNSIGLPVRPKVKRKSISNCKTLYSVDILGLIPRDKFFSEICNYSVKKHHMYNNYGVSKRDYTYPMSIINDNKHPRLKTYPKNMNLSMTRYRKLLNESSLFPIKIISILSNGDTKQTYDIEVEMANEFFCEGLLVHNSAQLIIGDLDDKQFINAKKWSTGDIPNWRSNSNNSIVCNDVNLLPESYWDSFKVNPITGKASGEIYGLVNLKLSRTKGRIKDCHRVDPDVSVLNPCIAGDCRVLTNYGYQKFEELEKHSKSYPNLKIFNGTVFQPAKVFKSGIKETVTLITKNGNSICCTPDHKILTEKGWLEARNCFDHIIDNITGEYEEYRVISLRKSCTTTVYDFTMEYGDPQGVVEGFIVHNCGEITLSPPQNTGEGEACNLFEIFISRCGNKEEFLSVAALGYKVTKTISSMNYHWSKTNKVIHKNMRLGVSISGICEWLGRINKEEGANWLDSGYKHLEELDEKYSNDNDLNTSIKLTTCKPSGTLSKLPSTSPGVHPFYAPYYIQRIRFASNDPLIPKLKENGYHVEPKIEFDGSYDYNTSVVSFPISSPKGSICAKDMSAVDQLELVKFINTHWSDNSTSVTVYFKEEELDGIKQWLKENYNDSIKSVSFLLHSNHGFVQAPYEEISEEKFLEMSKDVKQIYSSVEIGNHSLEENMECSSGACPIK
jgi:intein/homing endonuclease